MTSILKVEENQWDKSGGRKIRQKRIDFVLAYPRTFKIAAAIELDGDRNGDGGGRNGDGSSLPLRKCPVCQELDLSPFRLPHQAFDFCIC